MAKKKETKKTKVEAKKKAGTKKTPVLAVVDYGGRVQTWGPPRVNARNLRKAIDELGEKDAPRLMTDDLGPYRTVARQFARGHQRVRHGIGEYPKGDCHTNTVESLFALSKSGLFGIWHSVGKRHLHRYLVASSFRYNYRHLRSIFL